MNFKTNKQIFNLNFITMKKLLFYFVIAFAILSSSGMMAQQGFGTNMPDKSAAVDIVSTKRGMLIPRIELTATSVAAPVTTPATSLLVYNTNTAGDVTPGFYYWDGAKWVRFMDTDSNHTTTVVGGQGIIVTPDTTDPNNTEYTVSVDPGASDEMVLVTIENPDWGQPDEPQFITEWVAYSEFIDDLIGASNGLTYNAATNEIELGGALTRDTTIDTDEHDLTFNVGNGTEGSVIFDVAANGTLHFDVDADGVIQITGDGVAALDMDVDDMTDVTVAVMSSSGVLQKIPLEDLLAQTTYTADSGLTMTGNNVQLGGDLTQATTITTDGNTFEIATDGTGTLAITGLEAATAANTIVVADATTGVLRTVKRSISEATTATLNVANITDYSPYVQEVNVATTLAAADIDVVLPAASVENRGQVVNIRITNGDDSHDGYLNIKVGTNILTWGAMPYQGWIVKSDGDEWVVVGRN